MDAMLGAFLSASDVRFERTEASGRIEYRIAPSPKLPAGSHEGGTYIIGHARDLSEGEPLHPGHALLMAAVDEARRATVQPLAVAFGGAGAELPECLVPLVGRRGRLVVTKVAYRGLEPVDHLLPTALLSNEIAALDRATVEALLALPVRDAATAVEPLTIDAAALDDAVEEAVLEDQAATTKQEQARFERKLEQLDRYLQDQVLVLRRQQAERQRKLEEAERRKERATAPSAQAREDSAIQSFAKEIRRCDERIQRLEQGEDVEYQRWRTRLFERRFQRPHVERLLQVDFQVVGGAASC